MTPPLIFDRLLLRARRQRGLRLGPATFLLDQVADEFANRLRLVLRRFDLAVDLGTPRPRCAQRFCATAPSAP